MCVHVFTCGVGAQMLRSSVFFRVSLNPELTTSPRNPIKCLPRAGVTGRPTQLPGFSTWVLGLQILVFMPEPLSISAATRCIYLHFCQWGPSQCPSRKAAGVVAYSKAKHVGDEAVMRKAMALHSYPRASYCIRHSNKDRKISPQRDLNNRSNHPCGTIIKKFWEKNEFKIKYP